MGVHSYVIIVMMNGLYRGFCWPLRWLTILLASIFLVGQALSGNVSTVLASVTLTYFEAHPGDGFVTLKWETATELDNAGFMITRSTSENGAYLPASEFIPAEGDSLVGAVYEYIDSDVENGTTYWYKLEAIDFGQNVEVYGPVSATPNAINPTSTPTLTPSTTKTPTRTATVMANSPTATSSSQQTVTPTKTATRTPTATPPAAANTPSSTPTRTSVVIASSTFTLPPPSTSTPDTLPTTGADDGGDNGSARPVDTLVPLPSVTLVFPDLTETAVFLDSNRTPEVIAGVAVLDEGGKGGLSSGGTVFLIGLLAILWMGLGGLFWYSFRRIQ